MTEKIKQKLEKQFEKWLRKYLLCNDCKRKCTCIQLNAYCEEQVKQAYIAGASENGIQWHKVTDWKDNSQFPNDELKTYVVRLYQDHYVICEVNIREGYRQFYLPDNLEEIDPEEVIAWCEISEE